jgi:LDH2 family malate/lactate/ureidoglycolate dehydrogenase
MSRSPPSNSTAREARYSADALTGWATRVLETVQVPSADALTTAKMLVRSDLRGVGTHGLARLSAYVERLRTKEFNPHPRISFDRRGAAWVVEADGALGQVVGQRVVEEATRFLVDQPVLWVTLREASHLGALGMFALAAAECGNICFLGQRTPPLLGLPGFGQRALGHNPFAFAAPVGDGNPPFVFDMACSVAARGHILLAAREKKPIPGNWALNIEGVPTTDAAEAVDGMLQPSGDYKGMGVAMMIECLAGALGATAASNANPVMSLAASGVMGRASAFLFFVNPGLIGEMADFSSYMTHWIAHYKKAGTEFARIPGAHGDDMERVGRQIGLAYSPAIEAELQTLGRASGIPFAQEGPLR